LQETQEKKETYESKPLVSSKGREHLYALLDDWFQHHQADYDPDRSGDDPWETPLWAVAYVLKGQPDYRHLQGKEILQLFEQWLSSRELAWTGISEIDDAEEGQVEFLSTWKNVRLGAGYLPLQAALDIAEHRPLFFRSQCCPTTSYQRVLNLAFRLQELVGAGNILLPCENTSTLLEVAKITVSRLRDFAMEDGYLKKVQAHYFNPSKRGEARATEFRFNMTHPGITDRFGRPIHG
jgi:hypothetical protein